MIHIRRFRDAGIGDIYDKIMAGQRLDFDDGLSLFSCADLEAVGALANYVRQRMHGTNTHYVVNRQINYTNVCVNGCLFCAFRRDSESDSGAFLLSHADILDKIAAGGGEKLDELHMVGACHPDLRLEWFESLLEKIHSAWPSLPIKAFTPVEIAHFANQEGISTLEVLQRLKRVGLAMMPGGGAEIFDEELRNKICPHKASAAQWLEISGQAHGLGIPTNCTMLFGHLESDQHRVDHLLRLRAQQDQSGGFTCFIPLPFLKKNSKLQLPPDRQISRDGPDALKVIAVSRLLLDNIPHIKAYWIMLGEKLAQVALHYGADDLDGTIIEEKIGHMAGAESSQAVTVPELGWMIVQSGFTPVRRNATFKIAQSASTHEAYDQKGKNDAKSAMEAVSGGQRLTMEQARNLYLHAPLADLAYLADNKRLSLHPGGVVTYVGDRNINYSNICSCGCRFCAFYRSAQSPDAYVIDRDTMAAKIEETLRLGGTQILLQGGHHPGLPFSWYEDLLRWIADNWPMIHIHAFSPPEIFYWSRLYGMTVREILSRLKNAGLHSVPGGGAEILVNEVRKRVSPNKCSADEWLLVMEEAHRLGMKTTATMMFGHEESPDDRLAHLFAIRDLQDRTGGFTAFIPWTFQPLNTAIQVNRLPAPAYLRLLALSRLVLDNFDNIQASWVTMGPEIAQIALHYGANDFGSLMIEENVVAAAGVSYKMSRESIEQAIRDAGFTPRQRLMDYTLLEA